MSIYLREEKITFKSSEETWEDSYILLKITNHLTACSILRAENFFLNKIPFDFKCLLEHDTFL